MLRKFRMSENIKICYICEKEIKDCDYYKSKVDNHEIYICNRIYSKTGEYCEDYCIDCKFRDKEIIKLLEQISNLEESESELESQVEDMPNCESCNRIDLESHEPDVDESRD